MNEGRVRRGTGSSAELVPPPPPSKLVEVEPPTRAGTVRFSSTRSYCEPTQGKGTSSEATASPLVAQAYPVHFLTGLLFLYIPLPSLQPSRITPPPVRPKGLRTHLLMGSGGGQSCTYLRYEDASSTFRILTSGDVNTRNCAGYVGVRGGHIKKFFLPSPPPFLT